MNRRDNIEGLLCESIRQIQEMSGAEVGIVDSNTCPISDLPGFDSLRGVEATCMLEVVLKLKIPAKKGEVNLFVSENGRKALTVAEIADRILTLTN